MTLSRVLALLLLLALFLALGFVECQSQVVVGFNVGRVEARDKTVKLDIVIFSGSNSTISGEFDLALSPGLKLVGVEPGGDWEIKLLSGRRVFYRKQLPPVSISDPSVLATVTLEVEGSGKEFNIAISTFKAADKDGRDLAITFTNKSATIVVPPPTISTTLYTWALIVLVAIALAIILVYLAKKKAGVKGKQS